MKIIYVAKHGSVGNEDEAAITYALGKLGHKVTCLHEFQPSKHPGLIIRREGILLFHKWLDAELLPQVKIPKVFWYFDRVDFEQPEMGRLTRVRKAWMNLATELVDIGFCTDGDWVNQDTTGKLVRLTQGADERVVGLFKPTTEISGPPIMFSGSVGWGGKGRKSFVLEMKEKYGDNFNHVTSRHGKQLAETIAQSKIVVAPDFPCSDHYWSNRVYTALGFGAFMLHPYCATLRDQYTPDELPMYKTREELHELISHWLDKPRWREMIQQRALRTTRKQHLYLHRCEELIKTVQERFDIK